MHLMHPNYCQITIMDGVCMLFVVSTVTYIRPCYWTLLSRLTQKLTGGSRVMDVTLCKGYVNLYLVCGPVTLI